VRIAIHSDHPEPRKIRLVVEELDRGGVIAYPTDTVYGLGCDILNRKAIDKLYQIRAIAKDQLLSFICHDLSGIARYAFVDDTAYRIMKHLVPGPYTFILKATREVPKVLMMKRKTVGIRIPARPIALALARELGRPILSASAKVKGEYLVDPGEIDRQFHGLAMVIDADTGGMKPSTIIDLSADPPVIVRQGAGPIYFDSWYPPAL
jgi:tRNA threonylcarbamoyl adenosine modification protein (Sua5/YciO/YrdC/YwlC family)